MDTVTIGLGSNLGERLQELMRARAALARLLKHMRCSPIYETAPWGVTDQPAFLNAVCQGQTALAPLTVLAELKQIEHEMGRVVGPRWGPRVIDLDILFYDDLVLDIPALTLLHPQLHACAFVLVLLADLDSS